MSLNIVNLKELHKAIKLKASNLSDEELFEVNNLIALKLETESKKCFLKNTDPFGKPWKPLSKRSGQILRKSGRLFNSIASSATTSSIRIFVQGGLEYAEAHNNGTKGLQTVKAHQRKITQAFGKKISARTINIRQFVRNQNIPQRMFIPNEGFIPRSWLTIISDNITQKASK